MPNEAWWLVLLLVNFGLILAVFRLFGSRGLYVWVAVTVIAANIQVVKTVELFGVTATLGNIVYASSFLITDILSENYGVAEARRAVYYGFASVIGFTILMQISLFFEAAPVDFAQESLALIFGFLPRIVVASLLAYGVSQLHDVWAYAFWKRLLPDRRYLWVRNNASTIVSQLIDSLVFATVAFLGVFDTRTFLEILITTYLFKAIVAMCDTPCVYLARRWVEKRAVDV
ncbi:MAG: queuosine precursor transporter [Spirochaetota bacterium]